MQREEAGKEEGLGAGGVGSLRERSSHHGGCQLTRAMAASPTPKRQAKGERWQQRRWLIGGEGGDSDVSNRSLLTGQTMSCQTAQG